MAGDRDRRKALLLGIGMERRRMAHALAETRAHFDLSAAELRAELRACWAELARLREINKAAMVDRPNVMLQ